MVRCVLYIQIIVKMKMAQVDANVVFEILPSSYIKKSAVA